MLVSVGTAVVSSFKKDNRLKVSKKFNEMPNVSAESQRTALDQDRYLFYLLSNSYSPDSLRW